MNSGGAIKKESASPERPAERNETSATSPRVRLRIRPKKRKRRISGSSSEEDSTELPENAVEVDRKLQETAIRNNLTEDNVKKLLKKVVTNDHVLALVKLREEEEAADNEEKLLPKLTRAKAKELTRMSPTQAAPWTLELTPIKHLPVKTRPEVTALIGHDWPDESDEEYQPTNDDALSDEDATLESCSDVDSQPRTPASHGHTPASPLTDGKDGPFKIPGVRPGAKRARRDSAENATIARRTRSKLCLSATPIETIEQSFVPPDELPALPYVDDLWSNFLEGMLDPTPSQHEDDEEADPEYNAAADADADDEDEEALERSFVNISKKEIDDLFNELLSITHHPSLSENSPPLAPGQQQTCTIETAQGKIKTEEHTNGAGAESVVMVAPPKIPLPIPIKVEVEREASEKSSDEEPVLQPPRILRKSITKNSKAEVVNITVTNVGTTIVESVTVSGRGCRQPAAGGAAGGAAVGAAGGAGRPPRVLRSLHAKPPPPPVCVVIGDHSGPVVEATQVLILEQQLRQHVQLAATSYLQLYAHPRLWTYAPLYKDYLVSLTKMADECAARGRRSVVEVCNLRGALDLLISWEQTLLEDTQRNQEMIKHVEAESEKCMKRNVQNIVYSGSFHEMLMEVVVNSNVFVYPYLLPAMPFRCDSYRRSYFLLSEDSLIAMGLQQFYQHIENNRKEFKPPKPGIPLSQVVGLIIQCMLPWFSPRSFKHHIHIVRKANKTPNPIREFFETGTVKAVQHKLLAFNPKLTLHDQPEYEMPLQWNMFLSKGSQRAREYTKKKMRNRGHEPTGLEVDVGKGTNLAAPTKLPVPTIQTANHKFIVTSLADLNIVSVITDNAAETPQNTSMQILRTENGGLLLPVRFVAQGGTVNSMQAPIPSTRVAGAENDTSSINESTTPQICQISVKSHWEEPASVLNSEQPTSQLHCKCCLLMKDMSKNWPLITNYFKPTRTRSDTKDCCVNRKQPRMSRRLKYFLQNYKANSFVAWSELNSRIGSLEKITSDKRSKRRKESTMSNISELGCDSSETLDKEDIEDRLWVCGYVSRLSRWGQAQCDSLHQLFRKFDPDRDSPTKLYEDVCRELDGVGEARAEFPALLTAAQAERVGRFRDHFIGVHLDTLLRIVQEDVRDAKEERRLVEGVWAELSRGGSAACDLCCRLLRLAPNHRRLAHFLFSVTPHFSLPITPTPLAATPLAPAPIVITPLAPTPLAPKPLAPKPLAPKPLAPTPLAPKPLAPSRLAPTPLAPTRLTPTPLVIASLAPTPPAPTPLAPTQLSPTPLAPSPLVTPRSTTTRADTPLVPTPLATTLVTTTQPVTLQDSTSLAATQQVDTLPVTTDTDAPPEATMKKTKMLMCWTPSHAELDRGQPTVPPSPPCPNRSGRLEIDTPELTVSKTEVEESPDVSYSSVEGSPLRLKLEPADWSREEDKTLLEAIQYYAKPGERLLEVMEDAEIFDNVCSKLSEKSEDDVRERIDYLLQMLCTNGNR